MTKIAFIGLGNMGGPMAHNLHKAGHEVRAFDLSQPARDGASGWTKPWPTTHGPRHRRAASPR